MCSLLPKRRSEIVESCRLPGLGTSSSNRQAFGFERRASCHPASDVSSMSIHPLPTVCLMNVSCGCSSCRSSVESHDQVNSETLLRSSISNFSSLDSFFSSIFLISQQTPLHNFNGHKVLDSVSTSNKFFLSYISQTTNTTRFPLFRFRFLSIFC